MYNIKLSWSYLIKYLSCVFYDNYLQIKLKQINLHMFTLKDFTKQLYKFLHYTAPDFSLYLPQCPPNPYV